MNDVMLVYLGNFLFLFADLVMLVATAYDQVMIIRLGIISSKIMMVCAIIFVIGVEQQGMTAFLLSSIFMIILNFFKIAQYYFRNNIDSIPPNLVGLYCDKFSLFTPHEFMTLVKRSELTILQGDIIKRGVNPGALIIVLEGAVQMSIQHVPIKIYGPLLIGETAYLQKQGYGLANIRAYGAVPAIIIDYDILDGLYKKFPDFSQRFAHLMAQAQARKLELILSAFREKAGKIQVDLPNDQSVIYHKLFAPLGPFEFKTMYRSGTIRKLKGKILSEGDDFHKLYVLIKGKVHLKVKNTEICIDDMSFLSELSYVNQKTPVSADVFADGEITVIEYDNETLEHLDKRFHGFLARLHSAIALNLSLKLQGVYEKS